MSPHSKIFCLPPPQPQVFPSDADPLPLGTANAGSSNLYSRGDHQHPSDAAAPVDTTFRLSALTNANPQDLVGLSQVTGKIITVQLAAGFSATPGDTVIILESPLAQPFSSVAVLHGVLRVTSGTLAPTAFPIVLVQLSGGDTFFTLVDTTTGDTVNVAPGGITEGTLIASGSYISV